MSLAETVPYLRWRTTQLAQFELTYPLKDIMGKVTNVQCMRPTFRPSGVLVRSFFFGDGVLACGAVRLVFACESRVFPRSENAGVWLTRA